MTAEYGTQVDEEIRISEEDRDDLEILLAAKGKGAGWGNVVPVWVGDGEDGTMGLGGVDRWRNYAERGELSFLISHRSVVFSIANLGRACSYLAAIPLYPPARLLAERGLRSTGTFMVG